jgi:putative phosphoesterase
MRIGIISDTHGFLHPRIEEVFGGVEQILHAGDLGSMDVVRALERIAPVTFVPGNVDGVDDAVTRAELGGLRILLTHILPRPHAVGIHVASSLSQAPADVVVFGHSHLPHDERVGGLWYFNPASAGPRRFDYPVSVGIFEKRRGRWSGRHVALDERSVAALDRRMNQLSR